MHPSLLVVRVKEGILLIPGTDLLHSPVQVGLEQLQVLVGGVVLKALALEAQVEGALDAAGPASEDIPIGEGEGLGDVALAFVKEILVSEAWRTGGEGGGKMR